MDGKELDKIVKGVMEVTLHDGKRIYYDKDGIPRIKKEEKKMKEVLKEVLSCTDIAGIADRIIGAVNEYERAKVDMVVRNTILSILAMRDLNYYVRESKDDKKLYILSFDCIELERGIDFSKADPRKISDLVKDAFKHTEKGLTCSVAMDFHTVKSLSGEEVWVLNFSLFVRLKNKEVHYAKKSI